MAGDCGEAGGDHTWLQSPAAAVAVAAATIGLSAKCGAPSVVLAAPFGMMALVATLRSPRVHPRCCSTPAAGDGEPRACCGDTADQGACCGGTAEQGACCGDTAEQGGCCGDAAEQGGCCGDAREQGACCGDAAEHLVPACEPQGRDVALGSASAKTQDAVERQAASADTQQAAAAWRVGTAGEAKRSAQHTQLATDNPEEERRQPDAGAAFVRSGRAAGPETDSPGAASEGLAPEPVRQGPIVPDLSDIPDDAFCVLMLGDGNFSFSLALTRLLWPSGAKRFAVRDSVSEAAEGAVVDADFLQVAFSAVKDRLFLICTSFDDLPELLSKYPECRRILPALERHGRVKVFHSINAWELRAHFPTRKFDAIVWNHPHLGVEDFRLHRFLMAHFLHSAMECRAPAGTISVSLVQGQAQRWDLLGQAARVGLCEKHTSAFSPAAYPGYETRRNRTGNSFQNTQTQKHTGQGMSSELYVFSSMPLLAAGRAPPIPEVVADKPRKKGNGPEKDLGAGGAGQFACKECHRQFTSARGVRTHTRQVHELMKYGEGWSADRPKTLACPGCERKFHDPEALWQHRVSKHSRDGNIPPQGPLTDAEKELGGKDVHFIACEVCGQAVPSNWHMDQHTETLKPLLGIDASCLFCHRSFTEHRALRQHLNFCRLTYEGDNEEKLAPEPTVVTVANLRAATF